MSVVKEGFLYLEKRSLLTKTWKGQWFVLFKKKSTESPEIDEFILFHKNNNKNLDDDYMVTCIDIRTITGMKYISKKDRKIIQLQYSYKDNANNQLIHLSIENAYSLAEWFDQLSMAKDFMRENISLDGEFISRIQECPLYTAVNPRYDRFDLCDLSVASSYVCDDYTNQNNMNMNYIGVIQFPPKYFPFDHGDNVILTVQNDSICLKPAIMTIGGVDRTCVVWPLTMCSRFGTSKDCFYVDVDKSLSSGKTNSLSDSSNSGIFCIKSHLSGKILKDVLKYCKSRTDRKERKLYTSYIEPTNIRNFEPKLEVCTNIPKRRKSFFHYNSIYNYGKNETTLNAKSILKTPKRFFTIKRTKNN